MILFLTFFSESTSAVPAVAEDDDDGLSLWYLVGLLLIVGGSGMAIVVITNKVSTCLAISYRL